MWSDSQDSDIVHKLLENSNALLAVQVITKISSWAFMVYVVRSLGSVEYGQYSFALSFVGILGMLSDLGINNTFLVREISAQEHRASRIVQNAMALRIALSLGCALLGSFVVALMEISAHETLLISILGASVIAQGLSGLLNALFQGLQRSEYQVLPSCVGGLLNLALGGVMINLGLSAVGVSVAVLGSSIVTLLVSGVLARRFVDFDWELSISLWERMLRRGFMVGVALTFIGMYLKLDNVLLSRWQGDSAVGLYSAATSILFFSMFIPNALMGAFLPTMSNLRATDEHKMVDSYERITYLLIGLALFLVIMGEIFADKLILSLFGIQFEGAIRLFRISLLSLPFIFLNIIFFNQLIVLERFLVLIGINALGIASNFLLDYIMIVSGQWQNVAIVAVFVQIGVCLISLYYVLTQTKVSVSPSHLLRILLIGSFVTVVVYITRVFTVVSIMIGTVLYVMGLATFNVASIRNTIRLLREPRKKVGH